ncbi:MAG: hypothetical protein D6828_04825, partial [Nitrospirae bacterium]
LYATALCLTYKNNKKALKKAEKLILKAISINGTVEYYHQTLGYIYEVLETAYGEEGNLKRALEAYQKAYFLNDHENNPLNAANLLLNLGNGYFLLGQYRKAFNYYVKRIEVGIPFQDRVREIIFYRRYGAAAFQLHDSERTIKAYEKALSLIEERMEPKKASNAFDRLSRYIIDRIITPAMEHEKIKDEAKRVAKRQSKINSKLFKISRVDVLPPPDEEWNRYKKGIIELVEEQKKVNKDVVSIAEAIKKDEDVDQTLSFLTNKILEALKFPEQLFMLRIEIKDRLGLAYQEAGRWRRAMDIFEEVFNDNKKLGLHKNLVRNKRSVAYNAYMAAGELSGSEREKMLKRAEEEFKEVMRLVKKYGVGEKKKKKRSMIPIGISMEVSLN